jgi:hypothetical protein
MGMLHVLGLLATMTQEVTGTSSSPVARKKYHGPVPL